MTTSPLNRTRAASFFVGATLFWLVAFFLHKAGFIYVHTRDYSPEFRRFNEAMTLVERDLRELEDVLRGAEQAFLDVRAKRLLPEKEPYYGTADKILPEFYEQTAKALMSRTNSTLLILWKGDDYKIVAASDLCAAAAISRPDLVDPARNRQKLFCRWFGLWSEHGDQL